MRQNVLRDILRRLAKLEREALRFRKAKVVETATLEAEFGGSSVAQPTVVIDGIDVDDNDYVTAIGNKNDTLVLGRTVDTPNPSGGGGGASVGSGTPTTIQPDATASSGSSAEAARVDHRHAIVAATASTIDGTNAEGTSTSFARADHNHALGTGVVTTTQIADGTIATGDIADSAVTSAKIADATIATGDIADSAVTSAKIADGTIVNADVNASAAITYGKLSLTTSIVNGDISNSAAIAYSKLALTGSIVNADIATGAAIALSKLATDPLARANHTGTQTASTISDFDTQVRTNRLDQMATPTADVSFGSKKITSLADPTSAQDAATKTYVDTAAAAGVTFGTPGAIQPDDSASAGTASTAARSDHRHSIAAAAASSITGTNAEGSSTSFARADHNHALGTGVVDETAIGSGAVSTAKVKAEAWTTYTPTWTGSGGNPNLANHTRDGRYIQIGKTVHFAIKITFGSSSYGSGTYSFGIPVTAQSGSFFYAVYGRANDTGTAGHIVTGVIASTTTLTLNTAGNQSVGPTQPFTFGNNDTLTISGTYEAA